MNLFVAIVLTSMLGAVSEDALWWRHRHHRSGGRNRFEVCQRDTEGTCHLFGCARSRGPTSCEHGHCHCRPGYCSFGGTCMSSSSCNKATSGTCHLFGCSSRRGPTDCVHGQCVCQEDGCAFKNRCYSKCEKSTGAHCHIFGCHHWRHATCEHGHCTCGANSCNVKGRCESGRAFEELMEQLSSNATYDEDEEGDEDMDIMASATDNLPDMDDPMVIGLVAFGLGALMAGVLVLVVTRTRRTSALTSSLLVDEK
eukprot:NODE_14407_length_1110_cov_39.926755.p1 GENE.NODE_14407_length_1110_cov_39.926755~~NODE_14407_length_1110_cov_39.926755.p1  ORF type:complete len:254 (+),score=32.48 NODE_14407_length_1110_cov_39.926755:90-851(+)